MEPGDETMEVRERQMLAIANALWEGQNATLVVANGGEPDLGVLGRFAEMMDVARVEIGRDRMSIGSIRPTEEDVAAARHLVQLVRDGAPRETLAEAAWRVYRIAADPGAVDGLHDVLPWLTGNTEHPYYEYGELTSPSQMCEALDFAAAFCERGGNVRGFVPTAEDLSLIRRLRELITAEGAEAVAERQRLARELLARLPPRWVDPPRP